LVFPLSPPLKKEITLIENWPDKLKNFNIHSTNFDQYCFVFQEPFVEMENCCTNLRHKTQKKHFYFLHFQL